MSDGKKPEIVLPIDINVEWLPLPEPSFEDLELFATAQWIQGETLRQCAIPDHLLREIGATPEDVIRVATDILDGSARRDVQENN